MFDSSVYLCHILSFLQSSWVNSEQTGYRKYYTSIHITTLLKRNNTESQMLDQKQGCRYVLLLFCITTVCIQTLTQGVPLQSGTSGPARRVNHCDEYGYLRQSDSLTDCYICAKKTRSYHTFGMCCSNHRAYVDFCNNYLLGW